MATGDIKLDVLVLAAHPDDAELAVGGTILKLKAQGKKVGIADLTAGELGTRGSASTRAKEAAAAAEILGLEVRVNVGLPDGFFRNHEAEQKAVIQVIRRFRPEVVLINAITDRHPDHGKGSALGRDAAFLSGLRRIETYFEGNLQEAWRPKKVWSYIQDQMLIPQFVVDITPYIDQKMEAIKAFGSQFYDPNSDEPTTYISTPFFMDQVKARSMEMGHLIGVAYGEGFLSERPLRVEDLLEHL